MRNRITSIAIVLFVLTAIIQVHATNSQPTTRGFISGYITNKNTGHSLPDANIIIEGTPFGTASGDGGYYFIQNLPKGTCDVTVRVIGYQTETKKGIAVGDKTLLDFALTPTVIPMNPIIVSATRSDHLQNEVSISSEVFTLKRINEQNGHTAGEIIESAGGIFVKDNGGFAGLKTLSIRGSDESHVLVLLDGQRLNSAQMGGVDVNTIPSEVLERIEIVRGGHSALMGSDALGGAVHLITRESIPPKGFSYGLRSTLGSFGTKGINLFGSHRLGPLNCFISYNHTESDGDFAYAHPDTDTEETRENNDFKGENFFLKTKLALSRNGELRFIHQILKSQRGVTGSTDWPSPQARRGEDQRLYSLQWQHQITNRFRLKAQTYLHKSDQKFKDPGGWAPIDSRHENRVLGFDTQARWAVSSRLKLTAGGEIRQNRLESTDVGEQDRTTRSLYFQIELDHAFSVFALPFRWKWIPALRWDSHSDINSQLCPKLGLMISSGQNTSIAFRGNVGRSFRAPSFNDLYWPNDGFSYGNPDLKPEVGTNFDLGLLFCRSRSSFFRVDVTYFQNNITDLILWAEVAPWVWAPQNIGTAKIRGIENGWTLRLPNNRAYIKIAHTWMKAANETPDSPNKGNRLIYRPDNKLDISTGFTLSILRMNLNYRILGKRFTVEDNSNDLPEYHLLNGNIGLNFRLGEIAIDAKLQAQNLLDRSIYILEAYPIPGREFRFSLGFAY